MKAVILLGCEGRTDNGFIFCRGVTNIALDLEKAKYSENFPLLMEYIESVPKLFNGPCCKNNVVMNALYKFYELGYVNDTQYKYLTQFAQMHRMCGLILRIKEKDDGATVQ